jgi:hypothetical protein
MPKRLYLLVPLVCLLTTGCGHEPTKKPPAATEKPTEARPRKERDVGESVVKRFGGPEGVAIVENPTKTTAYRLGKLPKVKFDFEDDDDSDEIKYAPTPTTDEYPITAGPVPVPEDLSAELVDVLLDSDTYDKSQGNFCDFEPGVRLTFVGDDGHVDVLVCFKCDALEVHRDGKHVGGGYCKFARPALMRVAKKLFPDDEAIQGLPEKADGKSG